MACHHPVLLNEILENSKNISCFQQLLDATFGRGGHSLALKKHYPQLKILAFDRDSEAVCWGKNHFPNQKDFSIHQLNFHDFQREKERFFDLAQAPNMILLDLGASSPQLDQASRGFSFYQEGPLDMRMDQSRPLSAEIIVNQYTTNQLTEIFQNKGEIKNPHPVVRSIIRERKKYPINSTLKLARLIEKSVPWRGRHPATRYFLALRIEVNNELDGLKNSLPAFIKILKPEGLIFVLTFHSLEDRIVKNIFKNAILNKEGSLVNKKVIKPSREEIKINPRSRSAKLRIFRKGETVHA